MGWKADAVTQDVELILCVVELPSLASIEARIRLVLALWSLNLPAAGRKHAVAINLWPS